MKSDEFMKIYKDYKEKKISKVDMYTKTYKILKYFDYSTINFIEKIMFYILMGGIVLQLKYRYKINPDKLK